MISIITLEEAKRHLRITHSDADVDIADKILQASTLVMNHCKLASVPDAWILTSTSPVTYAIPADIQAAVAMETADLYLNRESSNSGVLSDKIVDMLRTYRDPTFA